MTTLDELARHAGEELAVVGVPPDPAPLAPRVRQRMRAERLRRGGIAAATVAVVAVVSLALRSDPPLDRLETDAPPVANIPPPLTPSSVTGDRTVADEGSSTTSVAPVVGQESTGPDVAAGGVPTSPPTGDMPDEPDGPDEPVTQTTVAPDLSAADALAVWESSAPSSYEWHFVFRFPALAECDAESIVTVVNGERSVQVLRDPPVHCPAGGFVYTPDVGEFLRSAVSVLVPYTGSFDPSLGVPLLVSGGTCAGADECITVLETLSFHLL